MRRILRRCLSFALFTFLSASAFAQAPPTDDSYSNGSNKNQKNGSNIFLVVQHGSDTYIKFNLATLPPSPSIAKATLRVYVDAVVNGGSFDVYQLNSSWSENTLTYNNAPALGISATGGHPVAIIASSINQFVLIDITSLVQAWASGTIANNGIALALTTSNGSFSFDSKESTLTSHHPELEIALNGAVGPQGPAGPEGATGPAGVAGAQGPAGPTGAVGAQGAAGPAGTTGAQGAVGPQGSVGLTGATGAAGAQGAQGLMGLTGPQGSQGTQGPAGTNGTGFNFTGPFSSSTSYNVNDGATYNGSTYVATVANQGGNTPDQNTADWTLMAQAGAIGSAGAAGAQGAQGPQGSTGATGAQGPTGLTGATGPQGAPGAQGPQGIQGLTGPQGPAGNSVGTSGMSTTTTILGAGYEVIAYTSTVPAGTYYVSAATTVLAAADSEVSCIIANSYGGSDKIPSLASGPTEVTISNLEVFPFTGQGFALFQLLCNVNVGGAGEVINSKITAILIESAY
jgi:hypothetical protein